VDLDNPTNETIERAVELANNVIWENRLITIKQVTSQEASELQLRKEPSREGDLRLIEIEGFDLTPCGGTHAYQTGEVGMIAVRSWERAKGLARIEFVAGIRALADYRSANQSARTIAGLFSAARADTPELAARMIEENKHLHRRVRSLEEIAARVEAEELLAVTSAQNNVRLVIEIFENRDAESLKQLALSLTSHPATVALLGSRDKDAARLVFARSADAPGDMNALMRDASAMLDGRGGGKPDMAQGGGKSVERLNEAIEMAAKQLR
jgi:alanyl-tRNA synthetase